MSWFIGLGSVFCGWTTSISVCRYVVTRFLRALFHSMCFDILPMWNLRLSEQFRIFSDERVALMELSWFFDDPEMTKSTLCVWLNMPRNHAKLDEVWLSGRFRAIEFRYKSNGSWFLWVALIEKRWDEKVMTRERWQTRRYASQPREHLLKAITPASLLPQTTSAYSSSSGSASIAALGCGLVFKGRWPDGTIGYEWMRMHWHVFGAKRFKRHHIRACSRSLGSMSRQGNAIPKPLCLIECPLP